MKILARGLVREGGLQAIVQGYKARPNSQLCTSRAICGLFSGRDGTGRAQPTRRWIRLEDLEAGHWSQLHPQAVDIPASFGLDKGVWFQIREGVRGILVLDERRHPHVYMLTEMASHYYNVMTRHDRMPVLIGSRI